MGNFWCRIEVGKRRDAGAAENLTIRTFEARSASEAAILKESLWITFIVSPAPPRKQPNENPATGPRISTRRSEISFGFLLTGGWNLASANKLAYSRRHPCGKRGRSERPTEAARKSRMRALITGVTGFVGGHLVRHLLSCGDRVLGASNNASWPEDWREFQSTVPLVAWDLSAGLPDSVFRAAHEFAPDAIYHLAALSIPADCGADEPTPLAIAVNVEGTRAVLELARRLPSRPRVLFISSGHVYAAPAGGEPVVDENCVVAPTSAYGHTKLAAESLVRAYVADHGVDAVIARAFKHAGPGQSPRLMLGEWASAFARDSDEPISIRCLDSHVDLSDVRDIVRAYRLLVERGRRGETYNVGSGINRRCGDIFFRLREIAAPHRAFRETMPGWRQEAIADIRKLVADTAWSASIPLDVTLSDTLEYWRQKLNESTTAR